MQYDIVKLIAAPSGSLTVVGDPDQSSALRAFMVAQNDGSSRTFVPAVYGWRNAEIENLEKMLKGEF